MIYKMRITRERVNDAITGKNLHIGDIIETTNRQRVEKAIDKGVAELYSATDGKKKSGRKIVLYASYLAPFGGIETATMELVKRYGHEKNMELIVNVTEPANLLRLSDYVDVKLDDKKPLEFDKNDVLILINYDAAAIIPRIKKWPAKIYQQNHAVWDQVPLLHFKEYLSHKDKINAVLSVSDEARRGLLARYDIDSTVVPNIISRPEETVVFGFFSRSTSEKGFDTILPAIRKFRAYGKPFLFVISTSVNNDSERSYISLKYDPNVCMLQRGLDNRGLIHSIDYLWQLSTTESMGLSAYEALLSGVPVIGSKIPVFEEIIEHGKNGYLVEHDLSDLPIADIFDKKLVKPRRALLDESKLKETEVIWERVFNGDF